MLPMTQEWVDKAEGDFGVILLLLKSRKRFRYDQICFHCQQCIEKYLKARLTEGSVPFAKSHDLIFMLNLVLPREPLWAGFAQALSVVTDYAVLPRYPGNNATRAKSQKAVSICRQFRSLARQALGLRP
jgi:HEPN domain-containing protein